MTKNIWNNPLLKPETKAFAFLATLMEDGTPQVTPVWFDHDGESIWINTAEGRVKDDNLRNRPDAAITFMAMDNPYHYLQIRGKVIERVYEGADEHINALSHIYDGQDFNIPAGQVRVIYKIAPK